MTDTRTIDRDNPPEGYETFSIFTDPDGSRYISYGYYIYNAECSIFGPEQDPNEEYTWRCV